MRKTLTYSGFLVGTIFVVMIFVTATNYLQLGIGIVLYPILAYFAFRLFPHTTWKSPVITINLPKLARAHKVEKEAPRHEHHDEEPKGQVEVTDIDKRAFLKLIGGAGISFFLFTLLGRRAENLFFDRAPAPETVSLKDATERKIDPAERQPTDGYRITQIEDELLSYYGFTNKDGAWFIMQEDTDNGSFRYAKGDSNFERGWNRREELKYDYYNNVFNNVS